MIMATILKVAILSLIAIAEGRRIAPDAVTGSAVRQLTNQQIDKIMANHQKDITPFMDDFANVKNVDGFRTPFDGEQCEGPELRIQCPGQKTAHHTPPNIVCVAEHQLCDHVADCPNGEDEDRRACVFYSLRRSYFGTVEKELRQIEKISARIEDLKKRLQKQTRKGGFRSLRQRHRLGNLRRYLKQKNELHD